MKIGRLSIWVIGCIISFDCFSQPSKHVVLITIDGFRPEFYLDPKWGAENLRTLMFNGARAKSVTGVYPSMTYPNHISIITGATPAKHGIYYNSPFLSITKKDSLYWKFSSIHSPTLWEAARNAGISTASVLWPVSAEAPVDYNIPDVGKLGSRTYGFAKPAGIIEEIKKNVFKEEGDDMKFLFYSPLYGSIDVNIANAAGYIIEKKRPGFISIHLMGLDAAQHSHGRDGHHIEEAVKQADRAIGVLIQALNAAGIRSQSTIIVTGDHGFLTTNTDVHPNVWLRDAGLINSVEKNEWKAFFYPVAGSSFLFLKDNGDSTTLRKVRDILNRRPQEEKKFFRIVNSNMLRKVEADPRVQLALTGENGGSFGWEISGQPIRMKEKIKGDHGHFPDFKEIQTGFIIEGAGIKNGIKIDKMNITDVAPLIADLLNLEMPIYTKQQHSIASLIIRNK